MVQNTKVQNSSDLLKKGINLYISGDYNAAINIFTNVIELDSNNRKAYYNRALVYYKLDQFCPVN